MEGVINCENSMEGSGTSALCFICCNYFKKLKVSSDLDLKEQQFNKFCEVVAGRRNFGGDSVSELIFKGGGSEDGGGDGGELSVCVDCLNLIDGVMVKKDKGREVECHVRVLQMEILRGLRKLEGILEEFEDGMRRVKDVVRGSNEMCLRGRRIQEELECGVFALRECILNEGGSGCTFGGNLEGDLWIPAPVHVKIEVDGDEQEEMEDSFLDGGDLDNFKEETGIKDEDCTKIKRRGRPRKVQGQINSPPKKKIKKGKMLAPPKKIKCGGGPTKTRRLRKYKRSKAGVMCKVPLVCDLCPFQHKREYIFEQHLRKHEDKCLSTFKCTLCPLTFSTEQYLRFHQLGHQGFYKITCDICSKQLPYTNIQNHLKEGHGLSEGLQIISCENCGYFCSSRESYTRHLQNYHTTGTFQCDLCPEKKMESRQDLLYHLDLMHGAIKIFKCEIDQCSKIFNKESSLRVHTRNFHGDPVEPGGVKPEEGPSSTCFECGKIFKNQKGLESHFKRFHGGEKPWSCDLCAGKYFKRVDLTTHKIKEHNAPKFKCQVCGEEFIYKRVMTLHANAYHLDRGFKCEKCGKICTSKGKLRCHLKCHGDERRFNCKECGKGFKHNQHLRVHMRKHNGELNWKCEYCGKGFTRKDNLGLHLRTHTGEKPYVCDVCGKAFNQRTPMTIHKKNVHKEVNQESVAVVEKFN